MRTHLLQAADLSLFNGRRRGEGKMEEILTARVDISQCSSSFQVIMSYIVRLKLGLFGTLKLALALQFIVTNAYFSVACNTKVSVRATLK